MLNFLKYARGHFDLDMNPERTPKIRQVFSFIWRFIRPYKLTFFIIAFVSLAWSLDYTLWPYVIRVIIDILTNHELNRSEVWNALKFVLFMGLGLWVAIEVGFRTQGFLLSKAIPRLEAQVRMSMFDHIQRHSPKYFQKHLAGTFGNKINDATTQISLMFNQALAVYFPAIGAFILGMVFLFQVKPIFGVILFCWVVVHFSICLLFIKNCDRLETIHSQSRSLLMGKIVDSLINQFSVNLLYRFDAEKRYMLQQQADEQNKHIHAKKNVEYMRIVLGIFTFLIGGILINSLMLYFWSKNLITTGEIVQIFNTSWNMTSMMWYITSEMPSLFQTIGIIKQSFSIMQDPQDIKDAPHAKPLVVSRGEIVFQNVSFGYSKESLFEKKDLIIHPKEKVGLVGTSGSGKSTFVNLILRVFPLNEGHIFIDGQDIAQVTLESLRKQISLIPQEPLLFHRTILENIQYGNEKASIEDVLRAAKLAHCDSFISRFPEGYNTLVGERGTKLSGGERQRIAIARAFLSNAPIILLDEATSSLDLYTENEIQDSFEELTHNKTTIVVAHRLSTLITMDRILVLDRGKIIEQGSHFQLIQMGGHYAQLWKMQVGDIIPESYLVQI